VLTTGGSVERTGGGSTELTAGGSTQLTAGDRLSELADWIADPQNPFFAAAQANRIWYHLMGRGIVEPIDDFRATNPASNPPLLAALRAELVSSNFNLRSLVRAICNSRTYQLSSEPNDANRDDERNFSHALVRRLAAEQLLDAVYQVSGTEPNFNGYPEGVRAGDLPGVQAVRPRDQRPSPDDAFLLAFGKPARLLSCECERPEATTLAQAFNLVSGEVVHKALAAPENRLGQMMADGMSSEQMVDELFWTALSRRPTADERAAAVGYLERASDRRAALEDIAWGLINAKEFLLRH
jgi:hypothetical protein